MLTFLFSLVIIDDIINMTLYMNRGETMDIGQRIRFVRLFRGMKQEELAEKIGLGGGENGRTRISQYENGKRTPKEDLLEKISDALIQTALCLASLAAIKQPDKALVYLNNITDMESEVDDLMINSRIADIHFKLKNIHQAAVIYNQILENTPEDDANYTEMRANAKYKLALYYGDDNPQTFQWQRDCSAYLEKIGILQKLSADERQIIRIIEDNLDDNIHQIVADIASHKNNAD